MKATAKFAWIFFIRYSVWKAVYSSHYNSVYDMDTESEPSQTSKMEFFTK